MECHNSDDVPLCMPHTAHWTVRSTRNSFNCALHFHIFVYISHHQKHVMIVVQQFPAFQIILNGTSSSNNLGINKHALADIFSP